MTWIIKSILKPDINPERLSILTHDWKFLRNQAPIFIAINARYRRKLCRRYQCRKCGYGLLIEYYWNFVYYEDYDRLNHLAHSLLDESLTFVGDRGCNEAIMKMACE